MFRLGKAFWRTTRTVINSTIAKIIVALLAGLGAADQLPIIQ